MRPESLEAAYAYLVTTLPFRRWKLPPAEEVGFRVTRSRTHYGQCLTERTDNGFQHTVEVSSVKNKSEGDLFQTMAHEMIHVYLDRRRVRAHHGPEFKRCAAIVCRRHGYKVETF